MASLGRLRECQRLETLWLIDLDMRRHGCNTIETFQPSLLRQALGRPRLRLSRSLIGELRLSDHEQRKEDMLSHPEDYGEEPIPCEADPWADMPDSAVSAAETTRGCPW